MQQNIELTELDKGNSDHLACMFEVRTHAEVDKYLRGSPPASYADHVNYLKNVGRHKRFYLIGIGSHLGGYCQMTISEAHIEIGMALHPDHSSKGVGSNALPKLFDQIQLDNDLKGKPIILFVKKDNTRAIALYRKHGFIPESENDHGEYLMRRNT